VAVSDLSNTAQDYLKLIWSSQEWPGQHATVKSLAAQLGVAVSTVSDSLKRLDEQGLITHAPYRSIELTERGRRYAISMVRRHRLIETFLVRELGYGWDEVHDEAEVLEHAVSDNMIERIDEKLGHPTRDPHGDPIPSADGDPHLPDAVRLSDLPDGASGVVVRISDDDPDILRYFDELGLGLDHPVTVVRNRDFAGTVSVRVGEPASTVERELGMPAARAIWVTLGGS